MNNVYVLWFYDTTKPEESSQFMGVYSTQESVIDHAEVIDWEESYSVWFDVVEPDTNRRVNSVHMYPSNGEDMTPTWIDENGKIVQ